MVKFMFMEFSKFYFGGLLYKKNILTNNVNRMVILTDVRRLSPRSRHRQATDVSNVNSMLNY